MTGQIGNQTAIRVSIHALAVNVLLALGKLLAGCLGHSAALLSDAVHSLADVLSSFIVMAGVKLAGEASDKEHPYGHERLECVAAIILAVILAMTGIMIGWSGLQKIIAGNYQSLNIPGSAALIAAFFCIAVKEGMYWYIRAAAKKFDSGAFMADAWHQRADAFTSLSSFVGILGARMGYPVLDSVACLVICLFIIKAAYVVFKDAISKMIDRACDDSVINEIRTVILAQPSVIHVDQIKTRIFGNKVYADIEFSTAGSITLYEAHHTAHQVHDAVKKFFPKVKHCMVHVNPYESA